MSNALELDELFAEILTREEIERSDNLCRAMIDRLAQALAETDPVWVIDEAHGICDVCCETGRWTAPNQIDHAPDCAYVWAVERAATISGYAT